MTTPKVVADTPLAPAVNELLAGRVDILPWEAIGGPESSRVAALYTYGHPLVDGPLLDKLPALCVISNYGVGVDHIRVGQAAARGILVGNTPGILDGATADMGFALLLAAARLVVAQPAVDACNRGAGGLEGRPLSDSRLLCFGAHGSVSGR